MAVSGMSSELLADLNSCQHLFLREISEPEQNSLRLLIEEGIASLKPTAVEVAGVAMGDGYKITSGQNARLFEARWDSYVAYSIRNESYVTRDDSEKFELGNLVRIYSESKFLEYVGKATIACDEYPGPSQHVEIICECHIIDVISTTVPTVKRLRPALSA